jgi:hypothetical protein
MKQRPLLTAFVALATFAAAVNTHAGTWERILPDPLYPEDGSAGIFNGGRSLAFQPGPIPETPLRVYLGSVNYVGAPTIRRLIPDAPGFPLDPVPEGVDGEPMGGLAWTTGMISIPGYGLWAAGRYTYQTANGTAYYWKVRNSLTGDLQDWHTADQWNLPLSRKSRSLGEANAFGIAASKTHVFVSGNANDGTGWRWIVRRKELASIEGFTDVLNIATAQSIRSRICYYRGNQVYPPAVLTCGKTPLIGKGSSARSDWAIRRSLDGGASFLEEHRWVPATANTEAIPLDIASDPSTGYIYAVGGLSRGEVLPRHGWVIRVNRHGGDPAKWETLLETSTQPGTAQRIEFANGRVFVSGIFLSDTSVTTGTGAVIASSSNPLDPNLSAWASAWTSSFLSPGFPFGETSTSSACVIAFAPDGKLYATGEVYDYTDGTISFPGTWLALARLPLTP